MWRKISQHYPKFPTNGKEISWKFRKKEKEKIIQNIKKIRKKIERNKVLSLSSSQQEESSSKSSEEISLGKEKSDFDEKDFTEIEKETSESLWKQKLTFETTKGPNKATSSFLQKNKPKSKKHKTILNEEGIEIKGQEAANHVGTYYSKLFSNEPISMEHFEQLKIEETISENARSILNNPFTISEIKDAILKTPNRSAGPSGISSTFFKKMIEIVAPLLTNLANDALLKGVTIDFLLKGIIALIPKKENVGKVTDYRPITLLEIPRKIITKAMTNRIKQVLKKEEIIHQQQFCHPKRNIHENILSLLFMTKMINKINEKELLSNKKTLHCLFVDFEKAFDRINHSYLIATLQKRNFGENFIRFIKTFLKGKSKVNFNGTFSEEIKVERGTPQGETLSPFLFILAIDPLIRIIQKNNQIKGFNLHNQTEIKTLNYADDMLLVSFLKESLEQMLKLIDVYCKASNAKISTTKTKILSFGPQPVEQIGEIKQTNDEIEHLGVLFNKEGVVNNLEKLLEQQIPTFSHFQNIFAKFIVKTNLLKSYSHSKVLYLAPILVFDSKSCAFGEKIKKWFLFSYDREDDQENSNFTSFKNKNLKKSNVSSKRLTRGKQFGGRFLHTLEEIGSSCKSKILLNLLKEENKQKPCYQMLKWIIDDEFDNNFSSIIHPLYRTSPIRKNKKVWDWLQQALITYSQIPKTFFCYPSKDFKILNLESNETNSFETNVETLNYNCETNTIPISNYFEAKKVSSSIWEDFVVLEIDEKVNKRCNLKSIFQSIERNKEPEWTSKQIEWINSGIQLEQLFTHKTGNTTRIEDFRIKFLMNYWSKNRFDCKLCGEKLSAFHILNECKNMKEIEILSYGETLRNMRIEDQFNLKSNNFDYCWILNWCLWKCYYKLVFDQETTISNLSFKIKFEIKKNEMIYLRILIPKMKNKSKQRQNELIQRTNKFIHFKIVNNQQNKQVIPI